LIAVIAIGLVFGNCKAFGALKVAVPTKVFKEIWLAFLCNEILHESFEQVQLDVFCATA